MGLLVLLVSADSPGMIKYFLMLSAPLMALSAFTFLTLFGLTSTGLALNWKMGKFKISLLASPSCLKVMGGWGGGWGVGDA